MKNITNMFLNAIGTKTDFETVSVKFSGRDYYANFPIFAVPDLSADPATLEIIDNQTGELLYYK